MFASILEINGQDTQMWMLLNLNLGENLAIIGWIHSHVQSMHCCFSSVDIHTQFAQQRMYEGSFGLVVEIKPDSTVGNYDAYMVSELGKAAVQECNRLHSPSRIQHESCSHEEFYYSIWHLITFTSDTITVLNFLNQTDMSLRSRRLRKNARLAVDEAEKLTKGPQQPEQRTTLKTSSASNSPQQQITEGKIF